MSSADLFVGWLPPIVLPRDEHAPTTSPSQRIWLPMRSSSSATLMGLLAGRGGTATRQSHQQASLLKCFRHDAALCLFTAAQLVQEHERRWRPIPSQWSTEQLAQWWMQHGQTTWDGEQFLATPDHKESSRLLERYTRLDQHFQTLPFSRWLLESDLWWKAARLHRSSGIRQSLHSIRLIDSRKETDGDHAGSSDDARGSTALQAHVTFGQVTSLQRECERLQEQLASTLEDARRDLAKQLAYGLSHEINNPLANISTRAQGLMSRVQDDRHAESLQRIVDQSYRAHAMIADLMFYANPPSPSLETTFSVAEVLQQTSERLRAKLLRDSIDLQVQCSPEIHCHGDRAMFGEALVALINNAMESIGVEGRIVVSVEAVSDGPCRLTIADSGEGISEEDARRAFDPYFSGREAGRGLGLSLCRVHRITEMHGGSIRLIPALVGCVAEMTWPQVK
ncbi:sensor histidine kinase [Rhodopirellula halodulae]|uniref:sensor histidine kinase n=1 Tax=Rhodopirellula halodulae TaxID=2894198 RepID=UPI001E40F4A1|nr:HAMP domain-containing sensor histidine kinase [Rhodopirellula sp. JC737]MCC9654920.1 HAMP domain-containing histidine kinase [Rhodopirellula sp. JC737]